MRRLSIFLLAAIVTLMTAAPASAAAPSREFLAAGPFDVDGPCPFVVHVEYPVNKEYLISFTDANGDLTRAIVQGDLVASYTNVENGRSVTLNVSGPGLFTFGADGSLRFSATGNSTFMFFPGQLGSGSPGSFFLNQGRLELLVAPDGFHETILSQQGKQTDVCALIS